MFPSANLELNPVFRFCPRVTFELPSDPLQIVLEELRTALPLCSAYKYLRAAWSGIFP